MMAKYGRTGIQLFAGEENIVGKGEIARYDQFLLFLQCFQNQSVVDVLKRVFIELRVNSSFCNKHVLRKSFLKNRKRCLQAEHKAFVQFD